MKMQLNQIVWAITALMCISSCSKEEIVKQITSNKDKIAIDTEIVVDGESVSTRAASEAGYTIGDGLYNKNDEVTVAAHANEGYELVRFYDKGGKSDQQNGSSYTFPAKEPQTFKAEFRKVKRNFIVVGSSGYIIAPEIITQYKTTLWTSVAVCNNKSFIIVGSFYTAYSEDAGVTWTTTSSNSKYIWTTLCDESSRVVAAGHEGWVMYSDNNGRSWNNLHLVGTNNWHSITYGNRKYVMVGDGGYITTSIDGSQWKEPQKVGGISWSGVTYGDGKYVAVSSYGYIATSTDGENWSTPVKTSFSGWTDVAYGNGKYIATGVSGEMIKSTNGINWDSFKVGSNLWNSITYGNNMFIVSGSSGYITTSIDGETWSTPEQIKDNSGNVINEQLSAISVIEN